jgi:hypothetical protein
VLLLLFLVKVFWISFSGAMQPGPATATVITLGARNRSADEEIEVKIRCQHDPGGLAGAKGRKT